jgi:hypothetical protein
MQTPQVTQATNFRKSKPKIIFDIGCDNLAPSMAIILSTHALHLQRQVHCRNPSFGLATKAKGLQGCGPKGSSKVTSGTPGSVGKCEGVNPHTPKATLTLGDGVPVDSRNFRDRFERSNLNGLWRSLY